MHLPDPIRVGCAGWTIPAAAKDSFGAGASHLARYATRFAAVEINSSFYRPHRSASYARWAESTPPDFRFAVKVPRRITHELRLERAEQEFAEFLAGPQSLGAKLGVLLVQLPPSARFVAASAERFFRVARELTAVPIACEPRHSSWFGHEAAALFGHYEVARVAADPACVPLAAEPGGATRLAYFRLHGSPRTYYSKYDDRYLDDLAIRLCQLRQEGRECWCVFDNTAEGAAYANALDLCDRLTTPAPPN